MTRIQAKEQAPISIARIYTEAELLDFNRKIQRFYETKALKNDILDNAGNILYPKGDTYKVLNWDELAVAFGAYVKKIGSYGKPYYAVAHGDDKPTRFEKFNNLMDQWSRFIYSRDARQEYAITKQNEALEHMASEQSDVLNTELF